MEVHKITSNLEIMAQKPAIIGGKVEYFGPSEIFEDRYFLWYFTLGDRIGIRANPRGVGEACAFIENFMRLEEGIYIFRGTTGKSSRIHVGGPESIFRLSDNGATPAYIDRIVSALEQNHVTYVAMTSLGKLGGRGEVLTFQSTPIEGNYAKPVALQVHYTSALSDAKHMKQRKKQR